jgi:RNA polymerase sigma-70 factor (ECF subfamily)
MSEQRQPQVSASGMRDGAQPPASPSPTTDPTTEVAQRHLDALRRGDEDAFMRLVALYQAALLHLALVYVGNRAVAEEVVQETWLAVLQGLDRFEGRSSLKTWIFRILVNIAKTRAQREGRSVPFSSLPDLELESDDPAVEPSRFRPSTDEWPGNWASLPRKWDTVPEQALLSRETLTRIERAIQALPPGQRAVIRMRDVDGCTSAEVCNILGIAETNQRVLLHRARSRVRHALEAYFNEEQAG